jgi:hypothetical protein
MKKIALLLMLLPMLASAHVSGNADQKESIYGEWRLVGWNDGGNWFEADNNYVGYHSLSVEIPKEGYMMAYSMVNEIFVGQLTLHGNEMIFDGEARHFMTEVYCDITENLFFEDHIFDIKFYQLDGNLLRLYYTDNDYFVFTSVINDSEGQTEDYYRPFLEDGKVWKYFFYNEINTFEVSRVVDGDTIIGGLAYKKILDNVGGQYLYALREEGKQVYIVYNHQETPSLLYDFSKDKGEMACGFRVADVDTIDIDGARFRRMRIIDSEWKGEETPWWASYWIEGVGSECLLEANYRQPGNYYNLKSCQINDRTYTQKELLTEPSKPQVAYRPFVEDGKVWKVGAEGSGNPVQWVEYYYFDGDTIIDGKACKKMMCERYINLDYAESNFISQENSLSYVGVWYEEDKKVYFYDTTNKQFKLMYDFSIEDNGTFQTNGLSYVIGSRQTGGIKGFKGVHRDVREYGDGENTFRCAPWLEGVGGVYGPPTTNVFNVELADPMWFLMSCTVGDEVIYFNDGYEDGATPEEVNARKQRIDFTHTIKIRPKARKEEAEPSLYGEYNALQLGINLNPLDDAYMVCITDETGKTVYEKTVNAGNIVGLNIDISAYAEGRYTVTVENDNESFTGVIDTRTMGIKEIEKLKDGNIYNLQGQRISTLRKGLNIVSGRKVYVK